MRIVRDADCPQCGWPETYAEGDTFPTHLGCSKCGWLVPVVSEEK